MTQKRQAPVALIKTWRERIGADSDFPLHAATPVERAMVMEIAELRAKLASQRIETMGKKNAD